MKRQFTSVIEKRGKWYVAFFEEIPGVNTQGRTLTEVRRNLKDALTMVIEANKELAARETKSQAVREEIVVNRCLTDSLSSTATPGCAAASACKKPSATAIEASQRTV